MNETPEKTSIKKTPGVCGGDACIGNRRIMAWLLVEYRRLGFSDERIMNSFAGPLSRADLDAAWDYYAHHPDEIETCIRENNQDFDDKDDPSIHVVR